MAGRDRPSRAERRRLRQRAEAVGAILAAATQHRDGAGRLRPITDPAALAVLSRGFAAMIRNDCRPVVLRLSGAEARALPGWRITPPGARWFAAFGLDCELRGTFTTRWQVAEGLAEAEADDAAEVALLEALARVCGVPGIPAGGVCNG